MGTLTQAECNKINNSYKMPYATQELFESTHGLAHAVDLGGLVVYFNDKDLVAFYDYENEWGAYGFENDNLKSGLYHANEQIKYLESHPVKELTDEEIIELQAEYGIDSDLTCHSVKDFVLAILRKAQEK